MSFSLNGPCSNTAPLCSLAALAGPAERELLHMQRSRYVQTYPLGGSSECNLQKDVMAGKGNPIVY